MRNKEAKEVRVDINKDVNKEVDSSEFEPSAEAKTIEAESAKGDAEMAKLTADLEGLRQSMLRSQADFANYRKRIEKERSEDSKRARLA